MCRYRPQLLPKRRRLSTRCKGWAGVVRLLTRRPIVSAPISFGKVYPTAVDTADVPRPSRRMTSWAATRPAVRDSAPARGPAEEPACTYRGGI
jgi:hypothetical protein